MLAEIEKSMEGVHALPPLPLRDDIHDGDSIDDIIRDAALRALASECIVPAGRFAVQVHRGWLTLSGLAAHPVERSAAECVVRYVPGVVGVTNRLVIAHADR